MASKGSEPISPIPIENPLGGACGLDYVVPFWCPPCFYTGGLLVFGPPGLAREPGNFDKITNFNNFESKLFVQFDY